MSQLIENSVTWSLDAVPRNPIRAGTSFRVKLRANVQPGWRLYALQEPEGGPIATEIAIADPSLVNLGSIRGPKPIQLLDPNFGKRVSFYVSEAAFDLPLTLVATATAGTHTTSVSTRYQSCNDVLCLPPKTVSLELTIQVKAR